MAEIYEALEIAGPKGERTGTWRMVTYSDEASKPLYHALCDHAHASPQEASECPDAKDATDRAFMRGRYAPPITEVPVSVLDGLVDMINSRIDEMSDQESRGRQYDAFDLRTAYCEIRDLLRGHVAKGSA